MINISNVLTGYGLRALQGDLAGGLILGQNTAQSNLLLLAMKTQIVRDLLAIVPDREVNASFAEAFQVLFLYI